MAGAAQAVAIASDPAGWPELVGTMAGDDTIFVATASAADQKRLVRRLEKQLPRRDKVMADPIVLAFSGGLDTSFAIPWLAETKPVTVTVDTGGLDAQAAEELARRSRVLGAADHLRIDVRGRTFDRVLRFLIVGNVRRGRFTRSASAPSG